MMRPLAFVDTSAIAAMLFREPGAEDLGARLQGFHLLASNLLAAELHAAVAREQLPAAVLGPFLAILQWVHPNRSLEPEFATVLAKGRLRGADLWHVACALYASELLLPVKFVTRDQRQREVASALGLDVV